MFDFLFGWRKASKCKKLIKKVRCRLELLKIKRHCIVRQLRIDVAQLIKIGYQDIAFHRAEHLFKDETTVSVYELLDDFCKFIISHLSYISRHKDCPNDINEAVSSLIFASARCGDLPELRTIRKLFGERYGQGFAMTALELLPGNLVNFQIKEKLCMQSVPDHVKHKLVSEIAMDYCLLPEIFAIEYASELQQQLYDDCHQDDMISTSINSSIVEQSSSDKMESPAGLRHLPDFEDVALGNKESKISIRTQNTVPDRNEEQTTTASSSENFPDEMIVYLDDIEEVQLSIAKQGTFQDQSIFKFKSSNNRKRGDKCFDSKGARKKPRRRSLSIENLSVKDIDGMIYYEKPIKKLTENASKRPYLRAMTMPQERSKDSRKENVFRYSKSFPAQSPNHHVHPKLPDYDELAAKFTALKKEHLQNRHYSGMEL